MAGNSWDKLYLNKIWLLCVLLLKTLLCEKSKGIASKVLAYLIAKQIVTLANGIIWILLCKLSCFWKKIYFLTASIYTANYSFGWHYEFKRFSLPFIIQTAPCDQLISINLSALFLEHFQHKTEVFVKICGCAKPPLLCSHVYLQEAFVWVFNTKKSVGKMDTSLWKKLWNRRVSLHEGLDIKAAQRDMGYQWEQVRILE